jgi:hypothetical protein
VDEPRAPSHAHPPRLNRGGDRTLNRALHAIAITRRRSDPTTIAYIHQRRAQGRPTAKSPAASPDNSTAT